MMKGKIVSAAAIAALVLSTFAFPAYAINDKFVPADECSGNPNAVGEPGGGPNPGLAQSTKVDPPASSNNPGQSTGARGQANSSAIGHCQNTTP